VGRKTRGAVRTGQIQANAPHSLPTTFRFGPNASAWRDGKETGRGSKGARLGPGSYHKLQWTAHAKHLIEKMATQKNALTRLAGSAWGIPMLQARQVYTMLIRPAISHAAHAQ